MKLLWEYIKKEKMILLGTLGLATINQGFSLLDPQFFRIIIDRFASHPENYAQSAFIQGVLLFLAASVGAAFVSRVAKNFQDYYTNVMTQRVGSRLYTHGISHAFSLPYAVFEDEHSGALLQKLQKARIDSRELIQNAISSIFLSLIGITFVVVYAFTVHWLIGLLYLLVIPTLGTATYLLSSKIKVAQKEIVAESAYLAGSTTETLRNVELVKSLGLEEQEIKRLNDVNDKILRLELAKIKLIRTLSFIQGTLINAIRALLLFLMLWLIFSKVISVGQLFTLFIYSFFIFSPLGDFARVSSQYQEAAGSVAAVEELLKIPKMPIEGKEKPINKIEGIEFKKVEFAYGTPGSPVLKNINLKVEAGETIAFVGPSGSGKTTLLKLIVGLYRPQKGTIEVNDMNSKDVDFQSLRNHVGLVTQETQLFAGTIRENLLFVKPSASDDECMQVLKLASALSIVHRGEKGLDTKIGEGGMKLSGGERQRLSIARSLLRDPSLIIFDEATSSLDSITEHEITRTIQEVENFRKDAITIMVAHRLSTLSHAKRIYVLERGEIIEVGSHSELLKKKGLYAALWREQSAV